MMNPKTFFPALLWYGTFFMVGCNTVKENQETHDYSISGDTVRLSGKHWSENLKIVRAEAISYSKEIVTAGIVRPIPTQYANIASPFAGRIVKSYIRIGQKITQGSPLFEITCPDFTTAQKEYFQALSLRNLAQKDLQRKEDLIKNGVSSQKELEDAQNNLLIAEKDFENAQAALRVYQIENPETMELGQPLIVRAPISGKVIRNDIVNGQYFKEDSEPIAVVADLSSVWVSAQVKEKDIRYIKEGDELNVEVAARPDKTLNGTVYHIEEAVDEETRSIRVLSICDNKEEAFKLGMYTTVHFHSRPQNMIRIPEKSLLQGEKESFVYIQIKENTFIRQNVEVESTSGEYAIISKGLNGGEKIIGEGGYYLK